MLQIVIPITGYDFQLGLALLRRLAGWKDQLSDKYHFKFLYTWQDQYDAEPLAQQFAKVHPNTSWCRLPDIPEGGGWPDGANWIFICAAQAAAGNPFYFMEADNFPLRPDFLDRLSQEYDEAGKPFMGVVRDTVDTDAGPTKITPYMVGTGFYPADFLLQSQRIHYVPQGVSFDLWIRGEVAPKAHHTKLIYHTLNPGKYKVESGQLVEESTGPVPREVAVIHKCKTLQLYELELPS